MKKRIALLSLAAIFAFATIATADNSNKNAAEPTKKEVKSEKKEGCCNEGAQKGDCKGEKKSDCKGEKKSDCKTEKQGCCKEKK